MSLTAVIGAGPAGLASAWELSKLGLDAVVFERDDLVGGISRTVEYKGYRFDIGGHRFFTKVDSVQDTWTEILGDEMLERPRLSRIYYDGTLFHYPLRPVGALLGLGPIEAVRVALSYLKVQLFPLREEDNFEQWVTNRFGRRLYEIFFKTYTEKVWGMPCTEIGAEWASQRIKNLDLATAIKDALLGDRFSGARRKGGEVVTTLIDQFHYPRLGPGMMWERCRDLLAERGVPTHMEAAVTRLRHENGRVVSVTVEQDGVATEWPVDHVISSMPVGELVLALDPPLPEAAREAAGRLRYRGFLTVVIIVERDDLFPDNWIYVHSPDVRLGRIQNFKNWSPEMVPEAGMTSLGLEYFVHPGDDLWCMDDEDLIRLGARECEVLGLVQADEVVDGAVVRVPKAYPVYDDRYQEALTVLREALDPIENLQTVGRNGQHRYNNQDHSMLAGALAARNVAGERHDVWAVNVDGEYHEERRGEAARTGDRLAPGRVATSVEGLLRSAFARYDPVALGAAVATVAGSGLFLATAILLLRGGEVVGPNLSLIGVFLFGFEASWRGAVVGAVEAAALGFVFGAGLAAVINRLIAFHETGVRRRLDLAGALDPLGGGDR